MNTTFILVFILTMKSSGENVATTSFSQEFEDYSSCVNAERKIKSTPMRLGHSGGLHVMCVPKESRAAPSKTLKPTTSYNDNSGLLYGGGICKESVKQCPSKLY